MRIFKELSIVQLRILEKCLNEGDSCPEGGEMEHLFLREHVMMELEERGERPIY